MEIGVVQIGPVDKKSPLKIIRVLGHTPQPIGWTAVVALMIVVVVRAVVV